MSSQELFMFMIRITIISLFFMLCSCQMEQQVEKTQDNGKKNLVRAASYNMQLGMAYMKQGDRPRAQSKLQQALKQNPDSVETNMALAYFFEEGKQFDKAKRFYQKAIAISPDSGAALNNYGAFLCRQGQYQEANRYLLKASEEASYVNAAGALENAGLCALLSKKSDDAIVYFQKALDQDGNRQTSFVELVRLYKQNEQYDKALKLIREHPEFVMNDVNVLHFAIQITHVLGEKTLEAGYKQQRQALSALTQNHGDLYDNNNNNG